MADSTSKFRIYTSFAVKNPESPGGDDPPQFPANIPFVERLQSGVVLQTALVDDELHALEERGGDCWWLLPQQNVDRLGRTHAQLAEATGRILAALGVLAVHETVCGRGEEEPAD